ncbi:hypothetical protein HPB52_012584 [Rhipicephalus sanguineus]|uniref:Uncharacterized protein n=1 Tax=Rhipicephalus sanguineus TaxID=34632 RepID=A0A9D4SP35_RHISA|nr:hypothetical protein HPB52_012584 [Rhipicephalus sanguineus]
MESAESAPSTKAVKKPRVQWTEKATWALIKSWEDTLDALRRQKHNGVVYERIAESLTDAEFLFGDEIVFWTNNKSVRQMLRDKELTLQKAANMYKRAEVAAQQNAAWDNERTQVDVSYWPVVGGPAWCWTKQHPTAADILGAKWRGASAQDMRRRYGHNWRWSCHMSGRLATTSRGRTGQVVLY